VHIWAAFVKDHIIGPYNLEKKATFTSKKLFFFYFFHFILIHSYSDIVEETLILFLNENTGHNQFFNRTMLPPCLSHILKWFTEKKIAVMKFPLCSPDINPIENLWSELSRFIYSRNHIFGSSEELIGTIKHACDEILKNKKAYLLNLHQSVLQRCIDILEHRGGEIKY